MGAPEIVPMFGLGVTQKSLTVNAQRRVNLYYEVQQDPDRAKVVAYRTPGTTPFASFGGQPSRGNFTPEASTYAYYVYGGTFYRVNNAGAIEAKGVLVTTAGNVSMEANETQIMIVDGTAGYIYNFVTDTFTPIISPNFPNGADTVTWLAGYFIVNFGNQFYISEANDGLVWPGDFATAESSPDAIVRVFADHEGVTILGVKTIEFWANTGNPDFPFERIPGSGREWGLAARDSLAEWPDALIFLGQNEQGQVSAVTLTGYQVNRISNHDLEDKWAAYGNFADAEGYSYMLDGHPMYVVSFPTGGESWLFDGSTGGWSQLVSYGSTRHRSQFLTRLLGRNLVTDYRNGNVYVLDEDAATDNGDPIRWDIVGRHVFDNFTRMRVKAFQLDIETGVGLANGQGSDPQAMLKISRDGGRTFGPERWKSFGKIGEYTKRAIWRRCGRARDFVFWVAGSDPVDTVIMGAGIAVKKGTS